MMTVQALSLYAFDIIASGLKIVKTPYRYAIKIQLNVDKEIEGTFFHRVNKLPNNGFGRGMIWTLIGPASDHGTLLGTLNAGIMLGSVERRYNRPVKKRQNNYGENGREKRLLWDL